MPLLLLHQLAMESAIVLIFSVIIITFYPKFPNFPEKGLLLEHELMALMTFSSCSNL
jgi:hypothetical protein